MTTDIEKIKGGLPLRYQRRLKRALRLADAAINYINPGAAAAAATGVAALRQYREEIASRAKPHRTSWDHDLRDCGEWEEEDAKAALPHLDAAIALLEEGEAAFVKRAAAEAETPAEGDAR